LTEQQDEAYVLETRQLGEADLIVTLLAARAGCVKGVAASARKSRRRFGGSLEPLTRVRARWAEREGRELHRIEALEADRSFAGMQAQPTLQAACAVLAEIALAFSREGEGDPRGFRLLGAVLEALEAGIDPRTGVRYYEYWTLRLHGLLPDLETCAGCGRGLGEGAERWVHEGGGVRCAACHRQASSGGRRLGKPEMELLRAIATRPPSELGGHDAAHQTKGGLEPLLRGSLEAFLEKPLRAYRHFRPLVEADSPRSGPA
jgi:DNA repair protein RecO (recombination protein O)